MGKKRDLVGQKFGRLTVLYGTGERKNGKVIWHCRCDCGNEVDIRSGDLISGRTTSCRCYQRKRTAEANTTHGMEGRRFGRLIVLHDTGERKNRCVVWHCKCDCGNEVNVRSSDLISGHTTSCGCYKRERVAEARTVHGMSQRGKGKYYPVYLTWRAMIQRCENPNAHAYKYYGGRGIAVCAEWHDAKIFIDWAIINGWKKGLTLDRIGNDGNYEPSNCRWVSKKEQARNKRNNHLITFNEKTQPMAQWAEELNISVQTLSSRIDQRHWPIERALTEPNYRRK